MKLKVVLLFVIFGLLFSCSTEVTKESNEQDHTLDSESNIESKYINEIDLDIKKIYSWINLMPSTDKGPKRFHITGDLIILPNDDYEFSSLTLKTISIIQDGKNIYLIRPTVREGENNNNKREIVFSTISGVELNNELNSEEKIDVELIFNNGKDSMSYFIKEVPINKVY